MTQLVRQTLPLILVILLTAWLAPSFQPGAVYAAPASQSITTTLEDNRAIPCRSLFPIGCKPNFALIIRQWAASHGLRWDRSQWGLPVYVEVDSADGWQRISVLCLHLTRAKP